jgi:DNA (cytosine-5)-methyltransferase 1
MKIGSICTGYGGLDMAVERVFKVDRMEWCVENDRHAAKVIDQRFDRVPNLGDLSEVNWNALYFRSFPVDILTAGYPCQPFSQAGLMKGKNDERHLWPYIREAICTLRPKLAILENVGGHRKLGFSDVLRDCAEDGHSVRWCSVRASDAGAPHGRDRLFFAVTPDPDGEGRQRGLVQHLRHEQADQSGGGAIQSVLGRNDSIPWDEYEPAIRRWEAVTGRAAPNPTEPNKFGRPRLTALFHEWMLGLPEGHVTDVDIPYTAKLRLTGNGVVVQQGELAIRELMKL